MISYSYEFSQKSMNKRHHRAVAYPYFKRHCTVPACPLTKILAACSAQTDKPIRTDLNLDLLRKPNSSFINKSGLSSQLCMVQFQMCLEKLNTLFLEQLPRQKSSTFSSSSSHGAKESQGQEKMIFVCL